jgi:hypothetical protein
MVRILITLSVRVICVLAMGAKREYLQVTGVFKTTQINATRQQKYLFSNASVRSSEIIVLNKLAQSFSFCTLTILLLL